MQIQLVRGEREVPTKQTHDKQIVLILFFIKNGPITPSFFVYVRPFNTSQFKFKLIKV